VTCLYSSISQQYCEDVDDPIPTLTPLESGVLTTAPLGYHVSQPSTSTLGASSAGAADITGTAIAVAAWEWCLTSGCYFTVTSNPVSVPANAVWSHTYNQAFTCVAKPDPTYLSSIAVTPASVSTTTGVGVQFTATGTYADGHTANLTSSATWTSSATSVATINASGIANGWAAGTTTITASSSGRSGSATLTITGGGESGGSGGGGDGGGCSGGASPIIIDTTGKGFQLTSANDGVVFDIAGDGSPVKLSWTAGSSRNAFLALDRNLNGKIDSGKELFGNFTEQAKSADPNGYLALAEFDKPGNGGNGDGVIDKRDAVFPKLLLWIDANHDGISQPTELYHLADLGIYSLSLTYKDSAHLDEYGNHFRYKGKVNPLGEPNKDQVDRTSYDVFFMLAQQNSSNANPQGGNPATTCK
jgi:hypothetical protein